MFPHREPPFHTDWWSVERLVPILLMLVLIAVVIWAVVRFTRQPRVVAAGGVDTGPDRSALTVRIGE
jgi:flagellar biogenesis protein FliO